MPRLLSWTTLLSGVFLAYFAYTFHVLYRLAVPEIPSLLHEDGRPKPTISPLWSKAKKGLTFELSLSLSQRLGGPQKKDAAPHELTVLSLRGLPYNWSLAAAMQLELEIVRSQESVAGLRIYCSDSAKDSTSSADELINNPTCRKIAKALDKARNCTRTTPRGLVVADSSAASGTGTFDLQGASLLLTAGRKVRSLWSSLKRKSFSGDSDEDKGDDEGSSGPVLLSELIDTSISTSTSQVAASGLLSPGFYGASAVDCASAADPSPGVEITARRIANAITSGTAVFAHSKVSWTSAKSTVSGSNDAASVDLTKVLFASAPLVSPLDYRPPKQTRFLLVDPTGEAAAERHRLALLTNATLPVETASKTLLAPAAMDKLKGKGKPGLTRLHLHTTAGPSSSPHYVPAAGHEWPHWASSIDVKLIMDTALLPRDEIPQQYRPYLRLDPSGSHYLPLLAANPVRPARESYLPLNHSIAFPLPLKVSFKPLSIGSWQLLQVLDNSLTAQQNLGASDKDTDEVVRLLSDTPLWLLTLTFVVSVFHLLIDMLAIQADVSFWKSTKSLKGISARSLAIQLVSAVVISLYLASEGSSLLVLVPQVLSTILLVWKLLKASGFVLTLRFKVLPWFAFDRSLAATATAAGTDKYDREAIVFMSLALSPLLLGFAVYSLVYQQWAGWADWALTSAVSAIYAGGFVLMVPQVWLNYRLKSVAAMPASVFFYRFFNTVIDDCFAAIITMPTATRLSVFRDDIVFVVYLWQRWAYKTDLTRAAETFEVGAEAEEANVEGEEAHADEAKGGKKTN